MIANARDGQESLRLDPRGRHAAICLTHLSYFACAKDASSTASASAPVAGKSSRSAGEAAYAMGHTTPIIPRSGVRTKHAFHGSTHWIASQDRTNELLRMLELGVTSGEDFVPPQEGFGGEKSEAGAGDGERGKGGGDSWSLRAFDEEPGGGVEAWVLLACAARGRGDAGGAVAMFRRALALDPDCLEGVCQKRTFRERN